MAYELIQFSSLENQPQFGKFAGGGAAVAFVGGWMSSGKPGTGALFAIAGLMIGSIVWFILRNNSVYAAAKADLAKRGHHTDFQVGNAFLDSKTKVIAFVDLQAKTYDLFRGQDILGWEHQWVDKVSASTNVWGDNIRANTRQASNVLVFKTTNLAKPLYKVPLISHRAGEEWVVRLGAIFNS